MNRIIYFIHIPKTAGTSFFKGVVEKNIPEEKIFNPKGFKEILFTNLNKYQFVYGHFPYGPHLFSTISHSYITFIRDPIDRALSHYYFVMQRDKAGNYHPEYHKHKQYDLKKIFSINKQEKNRIILPPHLIDNLQTRMIAGIGYSYRKRNSIKMLDKAKKNLEKMAIFGIKEKYDQSINLICRTFKWESAKVYFEQQTIYKKDVGVLDEKTIEIIRENHLLDIMLYDFALNLFDYRRNI